MNVVNVGQFVPWSTLLPLYSMIVITILILAFFRWADIGNTKRKSPNHNLIHDSPRDEEGSGNHEED